MVCLDPDILYLGPISNAYCKSPWKKNHSDALEELLQSAPKIMLLCSFCLSVQIFQLHLSHFWGNRKVPGYPHLVQTPWLILFALTWVSVGWAALSDSSPAGIPRMGLKLWKEFGPYLPNCPLEALICTSNARKKKNNQPTSHPTHTESFYEFFYKIRVEVFLLSLFWGFLIENLQYLLFSG